MDPTKPGDINLTPPVQNGPLLADDIFICILVNEKICILIKMSKGPIANNPALAQITVWHRKGDTPLSESMQTRFTDAYIRH